MVLRSIAVIVVITAAAAAVVITNINDWLNGETRGTIFVFLLLICHWCLASINDYFVETAQYCGNLCFSHMPFLWMTAAAAAAVITIIVDWLNWEGRGTILFFWCFRWSFVTPKMPELCPVETVEGRYDWRCSTIRSVLIFTDTFYYHTKPSTQRTFPKNHNKKQTQQKSFFLFLWNHRRPWRRKIKRNPPGDGTDKWLWCGLIAAGWRKSRKMKELLSSLLQEWGRDTQLLQGPTTTQGKIESTMPVDMQ